MVAVREEGLSEMDKASEMKCVVASGSVDDTGAMHEAASAVVSMFDEACAAAAMIPEDAPTKDALEDTAEQQAVDVARSAVMVGVHDIARRHDLSLEEVAGAFITARPMVSTDEQAIVIVDACAEMFVNRPPEAADLNLSELVLEMANVSKDIVKVKNRRVLVRDVPELVDARGNVIPLRRGTGKSTAVGEARITSPGTIVVEGGAPAPNLPPAIEYDGKIDPKLEAELAAGKSAYHLHTLDQLEAEAKEADAAVERVLSGEPAEVVIIDDPYKEPETLDRSDADKPVFRGTPSMRSPSNGVLLTMGLMGAALMAMSPSRPIAPPPAPPRPTTRGQGRPPRVIRARPGVTHAPAPARPGACGAAACRTLDACLCDCRKCRAGCPRKA